MSARIVNLRTARKRKKRDGARTEADRNAVLHGLTTAERTAIVDEARREARRHDGHRLVDEGRAAPADGIPPANDVPPADDR